MSSCSVVTEGAAPVRDKNDSMGTRSSMPGGIILVDFEIMMPYDRLILQGTRASSAKAASTGWIAPEPWKGKNAPAERKHTKHMKTGGRSWSWGVNFVFRSGTCFCRVLCQLHAAWNVRGASARVRSKPCRAEGDRLSTRAARRELPKKTQREGGRDGGGLLCSSAPPSRMANLWRARCVIWVFGDLGLRLETHLHVDGVKPAPSFHTNTHEAVRVSALDQVPHKSPRSSRMRDCNPTSRDCRGRQWLWGCQSHRHYLIAFWR